MICRKAIFPFCAQWSNGGGKGKNVQIDTKMRDTMKIENAKANAASKQEPRIQNDESLTLDWIEHET